MECANSHREDPPHFTRISNSYVTEPETKKGFRSVFFFTFPAKDFLGTGLVWPGVNEALDLDKPKVITLPSLQEPFAFVRWSRSFPCPEKLQFQRGQTLFGVKIEPTCNESDISEKKVLLQ